MVELHEGEIVEHIGNRLELSIKNHPQLVYKVDLYAVVVPHDSNGCHVPGRLAFLGLFRAVEEVFSRQEAIALLWVEELGVVPVQVLSVILD